MMLLALLFWILAGFTALSALAVCLTTQIVRSAVWLLFTLAGTAGLFFLLGAEFLGAAQLLIYVGGTMVLVIFGVMLTAASPGHSLQTNLAEWSLSLAMGVLLYAVLSVVLFSIPAATESPEDVPRSLLASKHLGAALLGNTSSTPPAWLTGFPSEKPMPRARVHYLFPFEIVSVHLLVVLVGAAYLARAKRRPEKAS
ncbi:MAG: NADH-quinone oxidoreductase subunit J [Gemmataceae bacterium]